jgi:hypothetical protein
MKNCTKVIFSNRACNSLISETLDKVPAGTGGILLGRIVDSIWYVIEVIDTGPRSTFNQPYLEYDTEYVNHRAKILSKQYHNDLEVLGLWRSHQENIDPLRITGKGTNDILANISEKGLLSGLLITNPEMRLTIYHVSSSLRNEKVSFEVADHLVPDKLFEYRHTEEIKLIDFYQYCLPYVSDNSLLVREE